ncbi:MAG: hypothetical protein JNJ91_02800 [Flavobacteriales bacterium]|nr:hypothetical protein [Flavobacteriales bacterium]
MRIRIALALAALSLSVLAAYAQPTDAQIIKDLTKPGLIKLVLDPGPTKKVWSSTYTQWFWERGYTSWYNANIPEYPNAQVEAGCTVRYHTGSPASYRESLVSYNEYHGIPTPSNEEIMAIVNGNMQSFLGQRYYRIIGDLHYVRMKPGAKATWHNPNSFSIPFEISYDEATDYTTVTTINETVETRFYRDAITSPLKNNMVTQDVERTTGATKTYSAEDLRALPTFNIVDEEKKTRSVNATLPTLEIPAFASDQEALDYTVNILRNGDEGRIRAYLGKMLIKDYYEASSSTVLNAQGKQLVEDVVRICCKEKMPWGEQYCARPAIKESQTNSFTVWNKVKEQFSRIEFMPGEAQWKNGQQVGGRMMIRNLELYIKTSNDDIARLRSYDPGYLCKEEGGEGKADTGNSVPSGTPQQSTNGGTLLNKGKGLLDRMTKP